MHGLAIGNRLSTGSLSGHQANPASMSRSTGPQLHKRSRHYRRWLLQFWTDACAKDKNNNELADRNGRNNCSREAIGSSPGKGGEHPKRPTREFGNERGRRGSRGRGCGLANGMNSLEGRPEGNAWTGSGSRLVGSWEETRRGRDTVVRRSPLLGVGALARATAGKGLVRSRKGIRSGLAWCFDLSPVLLPDWETGQSTRPGRT